MRDEELDESTLSTMGAVAAKDSTQHSNDNSSVRPTVDETAPCTETDDVRSPANDNEVVARSTPSSSSVVTSEDGQETTETANPSDIKGADEPSPLPVLLENPLPEIALIPCDNVSAHAVQDEPSVVPDPPLFRSDEAKLVASDCIQPLVSSEDGQAKTNTEIKRAVDSITSAYSSENPLPENTQASDDNGKAPSVQDEPPNIPIESVAQSDEAETVINICSQPAIDPENYSIVDEESVNVSQKADKCLPVVSEGMLDRVNELAEKVVTNEEKSREEQEKTENLKSNENITQMTVNELAEKVVTNEEKSREEQEKTENLKSNENITQMTVNELAEKVVINEEMSREEQEKTENLKSNENITETSSNIEICSEEITLKNEVLNNVQALNKSEILHCKEDATEVTKEIKNSISNSTSRTEVPIESMDVEASSNEQEPTEITNNNVPQVDSLSTIETENVDISELFKGPIGYGTDLDNSPSLQSVAYGCGICYCIVGYTKESFTRHQKNYHWISLQCKVCKKCFATTKTYENHMTTHIRYPCLHCPKEFKHPLEVEDHQGQHFSNKLIRCERCGEEFYLMATLKQHHSFMGTKCIEIQKNVRRIQQQLAFPLAKEELVKASKGCTSKTSKSDQKKNNSKRETTSNPTIGTRRSKRFKQDVKYDF